jgi:tellurite resistance protein TerC
MSFPSSPEVLETIPVILSLILINGLLSVDNSLAIAAMASRLPERQRARALNWGMAGAYGFRCLCLFFAAVILENDWVKLLGATYLIYLMCKELTEDEADENRDEVPHMPMHLHVEKSFSSVVAGILFLDASLSVDNVVAAIAMTPKLWAVYIGTGIGILALRFLAGYCIRLIERFPILEKTAFLLVGFVGVMLMFELFLDVNIGPIGKFVAIVAITASCLAYERIPVARAFLRPIVLVSYYPMRILARAVGLLFWPLGKAFDLISVSFRSKSST